MRLSLIPDPLRSSVTYKDIKCLCSSALFVLDHGVELAVREGSGSSLAKLNIGPLVQLASGPELIYNLAPLINIGSSL